MNGGAALFKALTGAGLDTCLANPGTSEGAKEMKGSHQISVLMVILLISLGSTINLTGAETP